MVGSVEPPPGLWDKISRAVGLTGQQQAPLALSEPPPMPSTTPLLADQRAFESMQPIAPLSPPPPPPVAAHAPRRNRLRLRQRPNLAPNSISRLNSGPRPRLLASSPNVIRLSGRVKAYRSLAVAMTAIAAALLAIIGVQVISPGLLPGLGGKPVTQIVEVRPTADAAARANAGAVLAICRVAAGRRGGPAFILTVDGATKNFTVRKLGAPPIDVGRNYELG